MNISTPPILNNQEVVDFPEKRYSVFFRGGGGEGGRKAAHWGKQLKSGRLVILILVMSQSFKRKIAASELQCYRAFLGYRGPRIYKMLTRSVRDANVATFIGSGHKKKPISIESKLLLGIQTLTCRDLLMSLTNSLKLLYWTPLPPYPNLYVNTNFRIRRLHLYRFPVDVRGHRPTSSGHHCIHIKELTRVIPNLCTSLKLTPNKAWAFKKKRSR